MEAPETSPKHAPAQLARNWETTISADGCSEVHVLKSGLLLELTWSRQNDYRAPGSGPPLLELAAPSRLLATLCGLGVLAGLVAFVAARLGWIAFWPAIKVALPLMLIGLVGTLADNRRVARGRGRRRPILRIREGMVELGPRGLEHAAVGRIVVTAGRGHWCVGACTANDAIEVARVNCKDEAELLAERLELALGARQRTAVTAAVAALKSTRAGSAATGNYES
jgi:hypothetical protein